MKMKMIKVFQALKAALSFIKLVRDPNRLEEVFKLSDGVSEREVLSEVARHFAMTPQGERALKECRRLPRFDLRELARLPEGTLGRVFGDHMISNGLDPAAIPTLDAKDSIEFTRAHLDETHDIWHTVTGFGTDIAGELGLQGFYFAQVRGPLPPVILAAGLLNTAFFAPMEFEKRMRAIVAGWIAGRRSRSRFGVNWDYAWSTPLAEVRAGLGLDPCGVMGGAEAARGLHSEVGAEVAGQLAVTLS
jgi:ubiquinone biosynthesis protein COQ4